MDKIFYRCEVCGNLVGLVEDGGAPMECCGQEMEILVPNTADAALEKHVPSVTLEGDKILVQIGETEHPMTAEHSIQWILIAQKNLTQRAELSPGDPPKFTFSIDPDGGSVNVYAYCNLHGLWKKTI